MTDVVFGYLTFLTNENNERRCDRFWSAVKSLVESSLLTYSGVSFVNVDNGSHSFVQEALNAIFARRVQMKGNFYDTALFYEALWEAKRLGARYVGFLYDDFIIDRGDFVSDVVGYLDKHPNVIGMRLPRYEFSNRKLYDTRYTSKDVNPDAVFHGSGLNGKPLVWSEEETMGVFKFVNCNMNYNSRPAIWRVSFLSETLESLDEPPIMQGFERFMMDVAEARDRDGRGFRVGFIDGGVCHTFPQQTSERLLVGCEGKGITVSRIEMKQRFDESLR